MRRVFVSVALAAMLMAVGSTSMATAQEATPSAGLLAGAGLPELSISVSASGYEGVPDEVQAGRYLLTISAAEDMEFGGGVSFVQPPEGSTAEEFLLAVAGPPAESGAPAATPVEGAIASPAASPDASPAAEEGEAAIPEVLFQARYAGGAFAGPGESAQVVLDLGPGEWIAWADDPEAPIEPVIFTVTGEMPAEMPELETSATIIMAEYIIEVSEGELVAGPQIVQIDNVGAQPHFIGWFLTPEGTTLEQLQTVLDEEMQAEMTGTPAAYSGINPEEDLTEVAFTATQSTGTSIWIEVDVPAGTNALICFFPDISDGIPHAFHGMYNIVEVAE